MARAIVKVSCELGCTSAVQAMRTFVCGCQQSTDLDKNPLQEFNRLLDVVAQEAFDAGVEYGKNPSSTEQ